MTLRTRLTLLLAVFAAVPVLATVWPVSRALSEGLEAEYGARLDRAARAVEDEYRRVAAETAEATRQLAAGGELEQLARDRAGPAFDAGEAAGRAAGWMEARGLDVLAVADPDGQVLSSGHLPGRAGDRDPELVALFAAAAPGVPVPVTVARATRDGVEPTLAAVAWAEAPGEAPRLRVAAGVALGDDFARRLASLTGGEIAVLAPGRPGPLARAAPEGQGRGLLARLIGATRARTREVALGSDGDGPRIAVTLPATGLARAQATVALTLLAALAAAVLGASLLGRLVAARVTRPVEALREAALRVAGGELSARVEARASGEVGVLVDAFNRMTADLAATAARAAAAERIAAWREVARRLAHEVKNPLTPVAMSVETLREAWARQRPDFAAIFDEGTRAIGEEVRRLKRIVDEFGRFARLPAPERRPEPAAALLEAALALYPEAPEAGVRVARRLPPELPVVSVDRDQILQVLHNLVKNAMEALGGAGRPGTVTVEARPTAASEARPAGLAITVRDDGPGIRPQDLPRLFEPYFTTKDQGTGLGLAIAQRIAQEHEGTLEAASPPEGGAAFTLWLPAAPAEAEADRSLTAPGSP